MFKSILVAALLSTTVAGAALASDVVADADKDAVTALLVADGYEVRSVQMEDGEIEVYAIKDGKMFEIYFETGDLTHYTVK